LLRADAFAVSEAGCSAIRAAAEYFQSLSQLDFQDAKLAASLLVGIIEINTIALEATAPIEKANVTRLDESARSPGEKGIGE
jgi:hypothetical protein